MLSQSAPVARNHQVEETKLQGREAGEIEPEDRLA